jgi:hypothetical protein
MGTWEARLRLVAPTERCFAAALICAHLREREQKDALNKHTFEFVTDEMGILLRLATKTIPLSISRTRGFGAFFCYCELKIRRMRYTHVFSGYKKVITSSLYISIYETSRAI